MNRFPGKNTAAIAGMLLGMVVCYFFGTVWLAWQMNLSFTSALFLGVVPYLPGDAVKILAVALTGPKLKAAIKRAEV